jgi:hypothetical protein
MPLTGGCIEMPAGIPSALTRSSGSIEPDGRWVRARLEPDRQRLLGIDQSATDPDGLKPRRAALTERARLETGWAGPVASPEKGRLTGGSGAAYTAPPDAVRKKNGAGRTDFPRLRKVDLARAKVLDSSSKGNYESDY